MKQKHLLSIVLIAGAALIISSCGPGRSYSSSRAPYVSLIITPSPGFTMSSYPDGRYYHRSPQGYMYWKGNDNRFFLDKRYLNKVNYNKWEYNEWRRWYDQDNRYNNRHR